MAHYRPGAPEAIRQLLEDNTFLHTGVVASDPREIQFAINKSPLLDRTTLEHTMFWHDSAHIDIDEEQTHYDMRANTTYTHIYIDGSVRRANTQWLATATWAIFVAPGHDRNASGTVPGKWYTSYRAETFALLETIRRFHQPIHIQCDNQAVVDTM